MQRTIEVNEIRELTDAEVDAVEGGIIIAPAVFALACVGAGMAGFTVGVGIGLAIYF